MAVVAAVVAEEGDLGGTDAASADRDRTGWSFPTPRMPEADSNPLIFVHVPKAAGSTLRTIITTQYGERRVFGFYGSIERRLAALQRETPSGRAQIRAYVGHVPFGLHRVLGARGSYLTMLRDPVERLISHHAFVVRTPGAALHEEVVANGWTVEEYVENSRQADYINNGQTRMLGGGLESWEPATQSTLEVAKRNLERFVVAGVVERFDESILAMRRAFGWDWPVYVREKVSSNRAPPGSLGDSARHRILARNELDGELWRYATQRFDAQIAKIGPGFAEELEWFRILNARHAEALLSGGPR